VCRADYVQNVWALFGSRGLGDGRGGRQRIKKAVRIIKEID
jgi:hypothetical protein